MNDNSQSFFKKYTKKINIAVIVFSLFVALTSFVFVDAQASCSSSQYSLEKITGQNTYSTIACFNNFNDAKLAMNKYKDVVIKHSSSLSPSKIIAMDRGIVAVDTKRTGRVHGSSDILVISKTLNLNSSTMNTYINDEHTAFYFGTSLATSHSNLLSAEIGISGYRGFVELTKVDLIPAIYVEKGWSMILGGNSNKPVYYNVPNVSYYISEYNTKTQRNEMSFHYYEVHTTKSVFYRYSINNYGVSPNWLENGVKYYSYNGIDFYYDIGLKNKVSNNKYYNYFQYLPLRSSSNHTASEYNTYLNALGYYSTSSSAMVNLGSAFTTGQNNYNINSLMIFALAAHESGWGSSGYALNRYNLFGWNAVDSNPNGASYFNSPTQSVHELMSEKITGYLSPTDFRHYGNAFADKLSGFNAKYASDPYWALKIANHMFDVDTYYGNTDLNYYTLGVVDDLTALNVRSGPGLNYSVYYTLNGNLYNQVVAIVAEENNWYKVLLQGNGFSSKYGYLSKDYVTLIDHNPIEDNETETPVIPEPVDPNPDLNITDILNVENYNGVLAGSGFNLETQVSTIKANILKDESVKSVSVKDVNAVTKNDQEVIKTYDSLIIELLDGTILEYEIAILGDINGDGLISASDYNAILRHILMIKILEPVEMIAADLNNDRIISASDYNIILRHILLIKTIY